MSVSYYLACHDCKELLNIGSQGISGWRFYSGEPHCMKALSKFVEKHTLMNGHRLEIVPEQSETQEQYPCIEW